MSASMDQSSAPITVTEYFGQQWISEGETVIAMCTRPEVAERIRRALAPTPSLQGVDTREAVAKELCRFSAEVSETWETTTHKDLYYGEADKILSLIHPQAAMTGDVRPWIASIRECSDDATKAGLPMLKWRLMTIADGIESCLPHPEREEVK